MYKNDREWIIFIMGIVRNRFNFILIIYYILKEFKNYYKNLKKKM